MSVVILKKIKTGVVHVDVRLAIKINKIFNTIAQRSDSVKKECAETL